MNKEDATYPEYYKCPTELYKVAKSMPPAQGSKLLMAAMDYFYEGEKPTNLPIRVEDVLSGWWGRIDKQRANSFAAIVKRNQDKKLTSSSSNNADTCAGSVQNLRATYPPDTDKDIDKDTDKDKDKEDSSPPSHTSQVLVQTPPSLDEVKQFFETNQLTGDAEDFYKYNAMNHWTDNRGNPVKNWKAFARKWKAAPAFKGASACVQEEREKPSVEWVMEHYKVTKDFAQGMIANGLY